MKAGERLKSTYAVVDNLNIRYQDSVTESADCGVSSWARRIYRKLVE